MSHLLIHVFESIISSSTQNPVSERQKLAMFLGRSYDDNFLREVTLATSIDVMRKQKGGPTDNNGPIMYRKGKQESYIHLLQPTMGFISRPTV